MAAAKASGKEGAGTGRNDCGYDWSFRDDGVIATRISIEVDDTSDDVTTGGT